MDETQCRQRPLQAAAFRVKRRFRVLIAAFIFYIRGSIMHLTELVAEHSLQITLYVYGPDMETSCPLLARLLIQT